MELTAGFHIGFITGIVLVALMTLWWWAGRNVKGDK